MTDKYDEVALDLARTGLAQNGPNAATEERCRSYAALIANTIRTAVKAEREACVDRVIAAADKDALVHVANAVAAIQNRETGQ